MLYYTISYTGAYYSIFLSMTNCLLRLCKTALDQLEHELFPKGDFQQDP